MAVSIAVPYAEGFPVSRCRGTRPVGAIAGRGSPSGTPSADIAVGCERHQLGLTRVSSSGLAAFRSTRQSPTANTCPCGIDPVDADRVTSRPIWRLLVRAAICRQHGRRHPASVTYSHSSLAGPGTDLRIAGRSRRSGSPSSSRLSCTGGAHACSGPRLRARRPLPRLRRGLMYRLARLLPVLGKAERDPIQGADNADCILKGFAGIDGDLQSVPFRMAAQLAKGPASDRLRYAQRVASAQNGPSPREVQTAKPLPALADSLRNSGQLLIRRSFGAPVAVRRTGQQWTRTSGSRRPCA